jgi:hypothetical protein
MTDLSPADIVLEYVCPALGMVIANVMFAAPYRDLQRAVHAGRGIGTLNPTPWAFMLGNCVGWTTYGVLKHNWFIFFANCPGFLLSVWLNLGAVKLLYQAHHSKQWRDSVATFLSKRERESLVASMAMAHPSSMMDIDDDDQQEGPAESESNDCRNDRDRSTSSANHASTVDHGNGQTQKQMQIEDGGGAATRDEEDPPLHAGQEGAAAPAAAVADTPDTTPTPSSASFNNNNLTTAQEWVNVVWQVTSQSQPAPAPHERLVMGMVLLWTTVIAIIGLSSLDATKVETMVGYVVNFNLVFFYGAPLSTIWTVLGRRDSSSIHIPTMTTNTLNGSFWTAYGIAVQDPFIYVPNGMGAVLGGVQAVLLLLFPRKSSGSGDVDEAAVVGDGNDAPDTATCP